MSTAIEATVISLLRKLESQRIRYAVLRNYETFPSLQVGDQSAPHTDIDLVVHSAQLQQLRAILVDAAAQHGWDILIECDHWAQSSTRAHNIEVFRFVRLQPLEHLQVDVFHGILIWGLPFYTERQMLEGRIYDYERSLTRIDPVKENLHRMLQIHGLYPAAKRKRERYREKVVAFRAANRTSFDRAIDTEWPRWGIKSLEALCAGDTGSFRRNLHLARAAFVLKYALRHPLAAASTISGRFNENTQRFFTRQCGAVIRTATRDDEQRDLVRSIMDDLVRASFMDVWRERRENQSISFRDHKEMEQGAIIIRWVDSRPELDLRPLHSRAQLVRALVNAWVHHHTELYTRNSHAVPTAEAAAGD